MVSQETSCFVQNSTVVRSCNTEPCPCPHVATQWSDWTECSVRCAGGVHRRSRDAILGSGPSCLKHPAVQTKTCNTDSCPDAGKYSWWDFPGGGEVFKGDPSNSSATQQCYDDKELLPLKAREYFVGMGREHIEAISPVKTVCGACVLFTTFEGKVSYYLHHFALICEICWNNS